MDKSITALRIGARMLELAGEESTLASSATAQSFSTDQRNRKYVQPQRIEQIMLEERLNEICTSKNVHIRPFLLLNFGDFFRSITVQKHVEQASLYLEQLRERLGSDAVVASG